MSEEQSPGVYHSYYAIALNDIELLKAKLAEVEKERDAAEKQCGEWQITANEVANDITAELTEMTAKLADAEHEIQAILNEKNEIIGKLGAAQEARKWALAELEQWKESCRDANARFKSAEDESQRLREALMRYATHTALCAVIGGYAYPCNCGLQQALAPQPEQTRGGE